MYSSYFSTRYGTGVVHATDQGVVRVDIPDMSRVDAAQHDVPPASNSSEITIRAAHMLQKYFEGERVDFADTPVLLEGLAPFRQKVLTATQNLTYGDICSYGQLAAECGSPHAARAVGGALAANPMPIIIPCHRIVASSGRLTGFSAPGGEVTKMALLTMEGIKFKGLRVVTKQQVMNSNTDR